jgi:hypothetical protein
MDPPVPGRIRAHLIFRFHSYTCQMKPTTTTTPQTNPFAAARHLLDGIKRHTAFALAGQIALGIELTHLKNELGFSHGGDRKSSPNDGGLKLTWSAWLKQELGIGEETARRFMMMAEAIRPKLKKLGGKEMLAILSKPTAQVTDADRDSIMALVVKCTDAQTQAEFLKEIGFCKAPVALPGGDSGVTPTRQTEEQMFLRLFTEPLALFVNAFSDPKAEEALWKLPLVSSDPSTPALATIEAALDSELRRVRSIRKKRENGQSLVIEA